MPLPNGAEAQGNRLGAAFIAAWLSFALGVGCSSGDNGTASAPANGGGAPGGGNVTGNGGGQIAGQSGLGGTTPGAGGAATAGGPAGGTAGAAGGAVAGAAGGAVAGAAGSGGGAAGGGGMTQMSSGGIGGASGHASIDGGACCTQRDCQPEAVRTCVCTTWQLDQCCSGDWDFACQTTAEAKCQADHCLPPPEPTGDAGTTDPTKGACCATHTTPGCAEKDVETCICGLLPDCCTDTWDAICVQLVREKHCEPGVRDCVCTTWQQQSCCDTDWTDVCRIVAEDKCNAQPSCP